MSLKDDLTFCVNYLATERFGEDKAKEMLAAADNDETELFSIYRNLVNVREPDPVPAEFIVTQDRMLKKVISDAGITDAATLDRTAFDGRISLWRGDITRLKVDAIVNAANSQMLGCWVPGHYCIDNAIHTFAGVKLRAECDRLMREQGYPEPTGMAKATDAYNLPSKWVIHTVGPIAGGSVTDVDCALLADCYKSCLTLAQSLGAKSIAFCCISTGVFGFPKRKAARIAVQTVRQWLDEANSEMHVIFNVFGKDDEEIYRKMLLTIL